MPRRRPEDTDAAILRKLEMIDRARALKAADREAARVAEAGAGDRDGDGDAEDDTDWDEVEAEAPPRPALPRITGCP